MITIATLFSGFELVGVGARQAGLSHLWGVEIEDPIANVAHLNGFETITADVLDVDPHTLPVPDILHASPVCTRASVANQSAEVNEDGLKESPLDIAMGEKVAHFIDVMRPKIVTIENVYGYRKFKAFKAICAALDRNGYFWDYDNLNSADFGVSQTRCRLILQASRVGLLPNLPQPVRWVGWYESILDLLDSLPTAYHSNLKQPCEWDSIGRPCRKTQGRCRGHFAPWQELRLPEELQSYLVAGGNTQLDKITSMARPGNEPAPTVFTDLKNNGRAFILAQGKYDNNLVKADAIQPIFTVTANSNQAGLKAFILNGTPGDNGKCVTLRQGDTPMFTVTSSQDRRPPRAFLVPGTNASNNTVRLADSPATVVDSSGHGVTRAWLSLGRVVSMTPRALARFQSMPDNYILPDNKKLACKGIGNGYPCLAYQKIITDLVETL